MIATLLQRLKGELALALIRTFIARGIAAVGGVLLFVVLGRLYGAEGVGVFALGRAATCPTSGGVSGCASQVSQRLH